MGKGPFKMKSAAHGGPMRRNFPSAFPKLDVKVGEEVFTGEEAYAKGKLAEVQRQIARDEGGPASEGIVGAGKTTQADVAQTKKENLELAEKQSKKIEYTGDDAHKRINETDWSFEGGTEAKRDAHTKVSEGGSYAV